LIATKDGTADANVPQNILDPWLSYGNEVNRGVEEREQEDPTVLQVARPWAGRVSSGAIDPSQLRAMRSWRRSLAYPDAEGRLPSLEARLRLVQTGGAGGIQPRLRLGPPAEYLAGLHLLDQYGEHENPCRTFVAQADVRQGAPEAFQGFLLVVT
jgi:hypothetical protein